MGKSQYCFCDHQSPQPLVNWFISEMLNQFNFQVDMLHLIRNFRNCGSSPSNIFITSSKFSRMQLSDLEYIHELLSKKVPYQEGQHETTILAVFLYAGIFSFDPTVSSNDGNLYLRIPNQEIYSYLTQQWVAKLAVSPTIFIGTKFPIMEYLLKDDDFHTLPEMTMSLSESLFQQAGCQRFGHVIIPTTNKKSKISELFTKNMLGNEKTIETLLAVTFQSALHSSSLKFKTVEQLSKASKSVDGSQDIIPRILDLMFFVEDITAVIIEIKYQKFQGENYNITEAFEQCISYSYLYRYCNTASVKFVKFLVIGVTETVKVDTRSVTISSSDLGAMMETRSVTISSSDLGAMMEISERKMKVDATNVITSSDLVTTMKTSEGKNNNKTDAKQGYYTWKTAMNEEMEKQHKAKIINYSTNYNGHLALRFFFVCFHINRKSMLKDED